MALRIAHNISAFNAHNQLLATDKSLGSSLKKLSSGFSVTTASDKPAGLVISEQLRAQIGGMEQAVANSQRASNIIGTAEGALTEMNTLLKSMRSLAVEAANSGGVDSQQIAANQAEVDSAISTIDRISNTTKFAGKRLLDGSQGFHSTDKTPDILSFDARSVQFGSASTANINIKVASAASRANGGMVTSSFDDDVTFRLTGKNGSEIFSFAANTSFDDQVAAINALQENTGVYIDPIAGTFSSVDYGDDAIVDIDILEGDQGVLKYSAFLNLGLNRGSDIVASVEGASVYASGNVISASSTFFSGTIEMKTTAGIGSTHSITFEESGMKFQLGADTNSNEQVLVGIANMHSSNLGSRAVETGSGTVSGYLSTLRSGQVNALAVDADTSVKVIDLAIEDVSRVRAELGAFQKNTLDSNINNLRVTAENLTASESRIRDVDFAKEMMGFAKKQILMQSGASMMAQANAGSQIVLSLLG